MGRSQLKYRPSRGRGQGDSTRGGRGSSERGGRGSSGRRTLESNASRYEERELQDDAAIDDTTSDAQRGNERSSAHRRQFFADEKNYREMGDVKESYFRTQAMQQWDAEEEEEEEGSNTGSLHTVGTMDFQWIAEQLAAVPLSLRYQIDPKYCDHLMVEQVAEESSTEQAAMGEPMTSVGGPSSTIPHRVESELDELLALSMRDTGAGTATTASSDQLQSSTDNATRPTTASLPPSQSSSAVPVITQDVPENLEDWLDDVLDM